MLKNLLVVELSSVLAGPLVGLFFAELGARVIKVENSRTNGDVTRRWKLGSESSKEDVSAYFASANFGKESIALHLKEPSDYALCVSLISKADILIHNFKPGEAEKLKLSYTDCQALNPLIIYGSINGYGHNDSRVGYDAIIQAESGYMSMNGAPHTPPTKLPVALMDVLAAHQLKQALLLALLKRETQKQGSCVHVSLLKSGLSSLVNQATNYLQAGVVARQQGSEHPNIVPYGTVFVTRDKVNIILAIGTDSQFESLLSVLEIQPMPIFATNQLRVQHRAELLEILEQRIAECESSSLLPLLHQRSVPVGSVQRIDEVLQTEAAEELLLRDGEYAALKTIAFQMEGLFEADLTRPPHYNEHEQSIRSEFT